MRKLAKRTQREDVQGWSQHAGRHALDGYLEDVMAQHAQSVDPADDRSARVFVGKDGKLMLISTRRETLDEISGVLKRGAPMICKLAKRPDEETLGQLMQDSPFSRGLAPPSRTATALPAHHEDEDTDEGAQPASEAAERYEVVRYARGGDGNGIDVSVYPTLEQAKAESVIFSRAHPRDDIVVEHEGREVAAFKNGRVRPVR